MSEEQVAATNAGPIDLAKFHAKEAQKAMAKANPGEWHMTLDEGGAFIIIRKKAEWIWSVTDVPGFSAPIIISG